MIFRSTFTFIAVLLLLIHNDQSQIRKRCKKCGSWSDDHIDFSSFGPFALIIFFPGGQCGIHHADPVSESLIESEQCLIRQGNLRDQHNSLPSPCDHLFDQLHIYFRLATAGNAVDQIGLSPSGIKIRKHFRNDGLLFLTQRITHCLYGLHFDWIAVAFRADQFCRAAFYNTVHCGSTDTQFPRDPLIGNRFLL